ncbi:prolipoprotein diacylglyceryl transferase [Candidatus Woesearchaeota archaeon]|nr:MAG: prolipoprotein diacylglyceryl transferase [Candidatus Woesearchaeota archaeon]
MLKHTINPTLLNLGPFEIRYYGIMYVIGFLFVMWYGKRAIREGKLKLTEKEYDDILGLLVLALIAGARLGYALFYNPAYFIENPLKIFAVWEGGLSFHGGFAGLLIAGWWITKKKGLKVLQFADILIVPLALANALGRVGNFINGELYGTATNLPWGVIFPGVSEPRHPTQLYEAGYNLIIFAILWKLKDKEGHQGKLFGLFCMLYSVFRFLVEFIKDLPVYGPLTMGQWLNIPLFALGVWLYSKNR